jgi:hypothetical protein
MCKFKTLSAVRLIAIAFSALPLMATAASAGHSVQTPQTYYGVTASANFAAPQSANIYAPAGAGNMIGNSSANLASGSSDVNLSGLTGGVNVQTNIDNSKSIDSSSNISVNETINGASVAYGLDGANVLNVIDQTNSAGANAQAATRANAAQGMADAILAAELNN